ncbi:hypothetical protein LPTSP3_g32690 [Leptospira kobayashii]|uniref:Alpha/beta hydrolase family protein n=1 Tax=Leptospira kobayashii TaxID=1917830 RepID=A0ABM7UMN7_9LEPT|nr:alpha/beta hydrolase [Leptospira kobayashii]BDA80339.1 hypothetical protein LPTSP3_g32690 [Leptospira kobayashii]
MNSIINLNRLEILTSGSADPKKLLLIWPSTGGNARSFRLKESELASKDYAIIRYNPASHGNSDGTYDPQTAVKDIIQFLKSKDWMHLPTVGIGHSGGGAALLMMEDFVNFSSRYLLSPILDSRLSLFYLYEKGNIKQFLDLLMTDEKSSELKKETILMQNEQTLRTLGNSDWLASGDVDILDFPVLNSKIRFSSLSLFLRNLFLPGFAVNDSLGKVTKPVKIFLPTSDDWFPIFRTEEAAKLASVSTETIPSAKDHFFTGSWISVWTRIKSEIL